MIAARDGRLVELLDGYAKGMYLSGEIISIFMDMLAEREDKAALWENLPEWVTTGIVLRLKNFGHDDEFVTFGKGDPSEVKRNMLSLKGWLITNGLMAK